MQVFTLGIFALQRSLKDIGAGGSLAFRDVNGSSCKHGCHVQILLEAGIGTGLAGHAVAPLDEHIAVLRHSGHLNALGGAGHLDGKRLAALVAAGQGAAAGFVHAIVRLILRFFLNNRGGDRLRAAGCLHRRAGVGGILGTGGDIIGIRAAILGLVGVGAQIAQRSLETSALEVDITVRVVIRLAVAIFSFEDLSRIQKFDPQLFAHVEQRHIKIIDFGLIHVGVIGVILRDRRHRVHDDIGVGVSLLNGLHQRGIVTDKISHLHAGVVGAKGHHDAAGLHFCHGLRDGVAVIVPLKGNDALVQGGTGANAFLGAELLQRDQTVGVQTHRVGIANKKGLLLIGVTSISSPGEQCAGSLVNLVVVGDILLPFRSGRRGNNGRIPRLLRRALAPLEHGKGDADGQQRRQCAHDAHQHRLLLHRGQRLVLLLIIASHILSILLPKE